MGNEPPASVFVVDTSSLMDWQARHYPRDIFVSLTSRVDELIEAGCFIAPALVEEELRSVGTADLVEWAKSRRSMFVAQEDVLEEGLKVQSAFPGLRDPRAEFEEADAYVIGLAQMRDAIVVTQETSAEEKRKPRRSHYIPDVCRELGISCISLLGMLRRQKWRF